MKTGRKIIQDKDMKVLRKGRYKGREFIVGKIGHSEEDILNKERTFSAALKTLSKIRKETDSMLYGKMFSLDKTVYGKRKAR